jgi:hypothetical protein
MAALAPLRNYTSLTDVTPNLANATPRGSPAPIALKSLNF